MGKAWVGLAFLVLACGAKVSDSSDPRGSGGTRHNGDLTGGTGGETENPRGNPGGAGGDTGTGGRQGPGTGGAIGDGGSTGTGGAIIIEPECPPIACAAIATLRLPLTVDYAALRRSKIGVCRNRICSSLPPYTLSSAPPPRGGGMNVALAPSGGDRTEVTVWTEDRGPSIVVDWVEVSDPKDGDHYSIEIDVDGMVASVTRKATYQSEQRFFTCPPCNRASFGKTAVDCCPVSPGPDGSMYTGGSVRAGDSCSVTYDFWCMDNFRIEQDADGCDQWKYDERTPRPGESDLCVPIDGGASQDAGRD